MRIGDFLYLWRVDDAEWVSKRKQDWMACEAGMGSQWTVQERKAKKAYFLQGRELTYFVEPVKFWMTPFNGAHECIDVFLALGNRFSRGFENFFNQVFFYGAYADFSTRSCPNASKAFFDVFLVGGFQPHLRLSDNVSFRFEHIADFCVQYIFSSEYAIDSGIGDAFMSNAFEFFISALNYVICEGDRSELKLLAEAAGPVRDILSAQFPEDSGLGSKFAGSMQFIERVFKEIDSYA